MSEQDNLASEDIRPVPAPDTDGGSGPEREPPKGSFLTGLSAKVLVLTISFVMIAEVLIYVPSMANFRVTWLRERLAAAQIASLALEAAPNRIVTRELKDELLTNVEAKAIALRRGSTSQLMLRTDEPFMVDRAFDLREGTWAGLIMDAFDTLARTENRVVRVMDMARHGSGELVDIVIDEELLHAAMVRYSFNILTLSIVISIITAALVFLALNWALVRPVRRLTRNMVKFSQDPEDKSRIIQPSARRDEIGIAERELAHMQDDLSAMLKQKSHLAALGLAVSKISHDLRNMLAGTQILSDRLGMVEDPTVKNIAPKLLSTIDRAIEFCEHTLKYGKAREQPPRRARFVLNELVDEVIDTVEALSPVPVSWRNDVPGGLLADADRAQLYRVLLNLCRNAAQAHGNSARDRRREVRIAAREDDSGVVVEVADNGPGVPEPARANLFEPFKGSGRPGGIGLGLAIAAELIQAHQGAIELAESEVGAVFRFTLPARISEVPQAKRQGKAAGQAQA